MARNWQFRAHIPSHIENLIIDYLLHHWIGVHTENDNYIKPIFALLSALVYANKHGIIVFIQNTRLWHNLATDATR